MLDLDESEAVCREYLVARRRRAQRRSRTALLQHRRRLVLSTVAGSPAIGLVGRTMIRGEPAIGRDQSRGAIGAPTLRPLSSYGVIDNTISLPRLRPAV